MLGIIISKINNYEVVLIVHSYAIGGAEKVYVDIVNAIHSHVNNIAFITLNKTSGVSYKNHLEQIVKIYDMNLNMHYKIGFIAGITKCKRAHTIIGGSTYLFYNSIPYISKEKKIIEIFHAFTNDKWGFSDERKKYLRRIDTTVTISWGIYEKLKKMNNGLNNLICIQNKINKKLFDIANKRNYNKQRLNVYFIGRNSDEKNLNLYEEIAHECKKYSDKFHFFVLTNKIIRKSSSIEAYFQFTNDEISYLNHFKRMDLLIVTSKIEGLPIVILEALASGALVISTNVGGIEQYNNERLVKFDYNSTTLNSIVEFLITGEAIKFYQTKELNINDIVMNVKEFDNSYINLIKKL